MLAHLVQPYSLCCWSLLFCCLCFLLSKPVPCYTSTLQEVESCWTCADRTSTVCCQMSVSSTCLCVLLLVSMSLLNFWLLHACMCCTFCVISCSAILLVVLRLCFGVLCVYAWATGDKEHSEQVTVAISASNRVETNCVQCKVLTNAASLLNCSDILMRIRML